MPTGSTTAGTGDHRLPFRLRRRLLVTAVAGLAFATGATGARIVLGASGADVGSRDTAAPRVEVRQPADHVVVEATGQDDLGRYAEVVLEGAAEDDRDGLLSWRWISDVQPGTLLNEASGTTRLYGQPCAAVEHDIVAAVVDDEANVSRRHVHVTVVSPC